MSLNCKIILVGEAGVGKTCIIKQYIDNNFDSEEIPTIAGQEVFKEITIGKDTIKLTIWDTCGQENFRSINSIFMKKSNIVIFVYDITNKKSFTELKDYWYSFISNNIDNDTVYGVAANKTDLIIDEKVHADEGNKYAESIHAIFKETSATRHEEIEEFFEELILEYLKKNNKKKVKNKNFELKKSKKNNYKTINKQSYNL